MFICTMTAYGVYFYWSFPEPSLFDIQEVRMSTCHVMTLIQC